MGDFLKIDASLVSHVGESGSTCGGSYYMSGKFTTKAPLTSSKISVENLKDMQLYVVSEGMEKEMPDRKSSVSLVEELHRYYQKYSEISDDFEEISGKLFDVTDETNNLINNIAEQDEDDLPQPSFAGLIVEENVAKAVYLGNSRIYLFRNGTLKQLTGDKRKADRLLRMGIITDEQAELISGRLNNSDTEQFPTPNKSDMIVLRPGDVFLLCSNNMLDYIDEEALLYILSLDGDSSYIAVTAMDEILKRQKQNDIILQIVKIVELKTQRESRTQRTVSRISTTSAAASAPTVSRPYRAAAASKLPSKKASHKIKKVIRLALSTIVIFAIVFGIFWGLERLLFGPNDKDADTTIDTNVTEPTQSKETDGNEEPDNTSQNTDTTTVPQNTSAPTTTRQTTTTTSGNTTNYELYTIKAGDSLMSISRQFYGTDSKYKLIQEFNNIEDPNHIQSGQVLKIPKE